MKAIIEFFSRAIDLLIGGLAVLQWLFTREPEHDLVEPPDGMPEVGSGLHYEDCR